MLLPALIVVAAVAKVAVMAAASGLASVLGRKAGERLLRGEDDETMSGRPGSMASAAALAKLAVAEKRAEGAERALEQERAVRRTLARLVLPAATLVGLLAGVLIGWLVFG